MKEASTGIISSFPVEYHGNKSKPEVTGVSPSFRSIRLWELEQGRFIESSDIDAFRKVCVIGQTVKEDLFPYQDPIGKYLSIMGKSFKVIGVLEAKGFSSRGRDQDKVLYVPFSTIQKRLLGQNHISFALASAVDKESIEIVQQRIKVMLRKRHNLKSYEDDDFTVMNQSEFTKTAVAISMIMTTLFGAAAVMTLISGGVGIMNIMLASTRERIREIGLRMALGARRKDISTQFFIEGLVLSLGGAIIGVLFGIGTSMLLSSLKNWAVVLSPPFLVVALVISTLVGVFFGFWPAKRAAKLNPIDALKYE